MNKDILGQALGVLNPHHIIGALFRFEYSENGLYEIELVGTILAYEICNGSALVLSVSNKTFKTYELLYISYSKSQWEVRYEVGARTDWCKGTLKLLK